ncbi:S-adenosylmethionine:tRNA ribosyltransferase-isomerase [Halalkalibacter akibai]|uniref:S-adenosylmethionine:tRNA ribosyltransferase-isomerase n=1 Tax=Halalkalibacter akibai (strain ATCC 43226 / DSM 21942 / CIP 109018 / JCM 9157 / 1139) TaxID=1236973 RepID=W4QRG7_HALA3|nr:S-adenosylmethionine:tRNA ribosyltransferase-isomerase [Halalkalibacter akibai]GAE34243.1 S-adenosylmethionine:tRNA ribosyltransferase-isomerase [Halalkalibacter akibai JCM 9157]
MKPLTYSFQVPAHLHANTPAEYRSSKREAVKLFVLDRHSGSYHHDNFDHFSTYLNKGDVLILNNSRTLPAVLHTIDKIEIRLAKKRQDDTWEALIIGALPKNGKLIFPDNVNATMKKSDSKKPLVTLQFSVSGNSFYEFLYRHGSPIRYEYIHREWPIQAYQTVFSSVPGSIEMPSAGRALSWKMLAQLQKKGVKIVFVQLHTGLSYFENDQWPEPSNHSEAFSVSNEVVTLIKQAKTTGSKVIAVGTTVVRALESAVDAYGMLRPTTGETTLHIKADTMLNVVDGLLTGFHEPEASHLDMLSAFIETPYLLTAYHEAINQGYLWHEFGDINLILPLNK